MNVFGYSSDNIFDQSLNTDDSVEFASVTVTDAISLPAQLATKLYVDTHGGGGGGNMTFVGGTPATNYLYKGYTADGLNTTRATITDDGSLVTVSAVNGITAPKIIKTGGTGIQYLMGDGSTLTQSATSGNSNFYLYQSINGITTPPPLSGDVGYNNANQSLATIVYINHLTRDNIDIEVFYNQVNQLSDLYIQDQNNSVNFIKYNITGLPTPVINSYIAIPVLAISSGGTGATSFGSNHNVLLAFFSNLTEVDTRLSTLETNTQNQTAVSLVTTFNDTVTVPIIKVQGIGSLSGNPLDSVTIGLGDYSVKLDAVNGVKAYSYALYSGTSSQFLKGDGIPDTNVYALASSVGQGMPYNPISGNSLTNTGTKALWYTGIAPYNTTINGIQLYIDSGGSDVCHFAIYRGYLKAGVGTNPGLNMTLVGQSASSLLLTTGLPYNRVPITVIGGQSLSFTAGSYLTIAIHASGTNNTFVCSPLGVISAGLCYTTISNYATTTFPSTITNSAISTVPSVRICFDLY